MFAEIIGGYMPEFDGVIWNDRQYDCAEEAAEDILESVAILYRDDPETWLEVLPKCLPIAEREYLQPPGLDAAIDVLLEGGSHDAANVLSDRAISDYLYLCEYNCEFSATKESLDNLQSALDVFWAKNNILFRLLGRFSAFDPYKHCFGKSALEKALNEFALANRHFWLCAESRDFVSLDVEFWKARLTNYLEVPA
jgi:hypothetical protein